MLVSLRKTSFPPPTPTFSLRVFCLISCSTEPVAPRASRDKAAIMLTTLLFFCFFFPPPVPRRPPLRPRIHVIMRFVNEEAVFAISLPSHQTLLSTSLCFPLILTCSQPPSSVLSRSSPAVGCLLILAPENEIVSEFMCCI